MALWFVAEYYRRGAFDIGGMLFPDSFIDRVIPFIAVVIGRRVTDSRVFTRINDHLLSSSFSFVGVREMVFCWGDFCVR